MFNNFFFMFQWFCSRLILRDCDSNDLLVGSIVTQYLCNKTKHDKMANCGPRVTKHNSRNFYEERRTIF